MLPARRRLACLVPGLAASLDGARRGGEEEDYRSLYLFTLARARRPIAIISAKHPCKCRDIVQLICNLYWFLRVF